MSSSDQRTIPDSVRGTGSSSGNMHYSERQADLIPVARYRNRSASVRSRLLLVLTGMAISAVCAGPAQALTPHNPMHVGVRCQDDFQYNWNPTIDAYSMCGQFINTIQGTDWIDFYFNLHGAAPVFNFGNPAETCNGCGGPDSVDFFFMETHGNTSLYDAYYAMWDWGSNAFSSLMRFGAVGEQLKVFATYACDTFKTSDQRFVNRWASAFQGGLKIGVGAHDLVYDGDPQKGWEFAGRMQNGEPIGNAWLEAVWYANNDNHPSAAVTGANIADCWYRMGMSLNGAETLAPLRDGQIGYYCWSGWNGY